MYLLIGSLYSLQAGGSVKDARGIEIIFVDDMDVPATTMIMVMRIIQFLFNEVIINCEY